MNYILPFSLFETKSDFDMALSGFKLNLGLTLKFIKMNNQKNVSNNIFFMRSIEDLKNRYYRIVQWCLPEQKKILDELINSTPELIEYLL